jgi:HPt (histidine-containing phosphotransfer) domain-containing protein
MSVTGENGDQEAIAKILDAMWEKFISDIRDRVSSLDAAASAAAAGKLNEELRAAAQSAAHKLAGTLGTFGLGLGTELARELEVRYTRSDIAVGEAAVLKDAAKQLRRMIEARK